MLSSRGLNNVNELSRPWRFTPTATYDPDTNPEGLISFGMAENVRAASLKRSPYHDDSLITLQGPMREEIVKYINEKVPHPVIRYLASIL